VYPCAFLPWADELITEIGLVFYVDAGGTYPTVSKEIDSLDYLLDAAKCFLSEQGCEDSDDDSEDEDDNDGTKSARYPNDNVGEIVEDLKTYTRSLMDLIPSIEWPARDPEEMKAALGLSALKDRHPHQYYADRIREMFPEAAPDLVERLGCANLGRYLERYKRIQTERNPLAAQGTVNVERNLPVACEKSTFNDSGLGTSVPATTSYAQSTCSAAQSINSAISSCVAGTRVRIPPLSEEAKKGGAFSCCACGKSVKIKTTREWRYVEACQVNSATHGSGY
jgi:hypothetical protein